MPLSRPAALAALLCCGVTLAFGADAKKRPPTIADIMKVRNVVDLAISPDGRSVAYVVSVPDAKEGRYNTDLWLVPTSGGRPTQLTNSPRRDDKPAWSPDGKTVAFLSDREGKKAQVWLIAPAGGEARKLSDLEGGVVDLAWSPAGKHIAVIAGEPETKEEKKRKEDREDVTVVEQDDKPNQLHLVDVGTGKSRQLTRGQEQVQNLAWSPDGKTIACAVRRSPRLADLMHVDLVTVNVADGKAKDLVRRPGLDTAPRYSPDGKQIAFISHGGQFDWIANTYLCVIPAEGGTPRTVSKGLDEILPWSDPQGAHWSADGKSLYITAATKLSSHLHSVDVSSGAVKHWPAGEGLVDRLRVSRDGTHAAFLVEAPNQPPEVCAGRWPDQFKRITTTNPQLDELQLGQVEAVRWKGKDGLALDGVLILPPGRKGKERVPLLTYVHGGPQGRFALSFSPQRWGTAQAEPYPVHVLAGKGLAVFCPNPRGSGGYGQKFRQANVKDWGFGDFEDIQTGIDALVERGVADKDRLGIMGWSYGGYMTGWAITRTDRFKAASAGAGVFNLYSMYGTTDIQPFMERYFGGTPWKSRAAYEKHSSIFSADKVKTPTLIQHGDKDLRVPIAQSQELFRALKRNTVPVEMVVYPRQAHIIGEPALQRDAMRRNVEWFEKWLLR